MKKFLFLLSLFSLFTLVACGSDSGNENDEKLKAHIAGRWISDDFFDIVFEENYTGYLEVIKAAFDAASGNIVIIGTFHDCFSYGIKNGKVSLRFNGDVMMDAGTRWEFNYDGGNSFNVSYRDLRYTRKQETSDK